MTLSSGSSAASSSAEHATEESERATDSSQGALARLDALAQKTRQKAGEMVDTVQNAPENIEAALDRQRKATLEGIEGTVEKTMNSLFERVSQPVSKFFKSMKTMWDENPHERRRMLVVGGIATIGITVVTLAFIKAIKSEESSDSKGKESSEQEEGFFTKFFKKLFGLDQASSMFDKVKKGTALATLFASGGVGAVWAYIHHEVGGLEPEAKKQRIDEIVEQMGLSGKPKETLRQGLYTLAGVGKIAETIDEKLVEWQAKWDTLRPDILKKYPFSEYPELETWLPKDFKTIVGWVTIPTAGLGFTAILGAAMGRGLPFMLGKLITAPFALLKIAASPLGIAALAGTLGVVVFGMENEESGKTLWEEWIETEEGKSFLANLQERIISLGINEDAKAAIEGWVEDPTFANAFNAIKEETEGILRAMGAEPEFLDNISQEEITAGMLKFREVTGIDRLETALEGKQMAGISGEAFGVAGGGLALFVLAYALFRPERLARLGMKAAETAPFAIGVYSILKMFGIPVPFADDLVPEDIQEALEVYDLHEYGELIVDVLQSDVLPEVIDLLEFVKNQAVDLHGSFQKSFPAAAAFLPSMEDIQNLNPITFIALLVEGNVGTEELTEGLKSAGKVTIGCLLLKGFFAHPKLSKWAFIGFVGYCLVNTSGKEALTKSEITGLPEWINTENKIADLGLNGILSGFEYGHEFADIFVSLLEKFKAVGAHKAIEALEKFNRGESSLWQLFMELLEAAKTEPISFGVSFTGAGICVLGEWFLIDPGASFLRALWQVMQLRFSDGLQSYMAGVIPFAVLNTGLQAVRHGINVKSFAYALRGSLTAPLRPVYLAWDMLSGRTLPEVTLMGNKLLYKLKGFKGGEEVLQMRYMIAHARLKMHYTRSWFLRSPADKLSAEVADIADELRTKFKYTPEQFTQLETRAEETLCRRRGGLKRFERMATRWDEERLFARELEDIVDIRKIADKISPGDYHRLAKLKDLEEIRFLLKKRGITCPDNILELIRDTDTAEEMIKIIGINTSNSEKVAMIMLHDIATNQALLQALSNATDPARVKSILIHSKKVDAAIINGIPDDSPFIRSLAQADDPEVIAKILTQSRSVALFGKAVHVAGAAGAVAGVITDIIAIMSTYDQMRSARSDTLRDFYAAKLWGHGAFLAVDSVSAVLTIQGTFAAFGVGTSWTGVGPVVAAAGIALLEAGRYTYEKATEASEIHARQMEDWLQKSPEELLFIWFYRSSGDYTAAEKLRYLNDNLSEMNYAVVGKIVRALCYALMPENPPGNQLAEYAFEYFQDRGFQIKTYEEGRERMGIAFEYALLRHQARQAEGGIYIPSPWNPKEEINLSELDFATLTPLERMRIFDSYQEYSKKEQEKLLQTPRARKIIRNIERLDTSTLEYRLYQVQEYMTLYGRLESKDREFYEICLLYLTLRHAIDIPFQPTEKNNRQGVELWMNSDGKEFREVVVFANIETYRQGIVMTDEEIISFVEYAGDIEVFAFYKLALYMGYTGKPDIYALRSFFPEYDKSFKGVYWDGTEWMVNDSNGFDQSCGHGEDAVERVFSNLKSQKTAAFDYEGEAFYRSDHGIDARLQIFVEGLQAEVQKARQEKKKLQRQARHFPRKVRTYLQQYYLETEESTKDKWLALPIELLAMGMNADYTDENEKKHSHHNLGKFLYRYERGEIIALPLTLEPCEAPDFVDTIVERHETHDLTPEMKVEIAKIRAQIEEVRTVVEVDNNEFDASEAVKEIYREEFAKLTAWESDLILFPASTQRAMIRAKRGEVLLFQQCFLIAFLAMSADNWFSNDVDDADADEKIRQAIRNGGNDSYYHQGQIKEEFQKYVSPEDETILREKTYGTEYQNYYERAMALALYKSYTLKNTNGRVASQQDQNLDRIELAKNLTKVYSYSRWVRTFKGKAAWEQEFGDKTPQEIRQQDFPRWKKSLGDREIEFLRAG